MGLPPATDEAICATIGLSLPATLERLTGPQPAARQDEFVRLFVSRADVVMVARTSLLPGVPAAIEALRAQGLSLAIVSNKFRRRIEAVLQREGLRAPFDAIVGGEDMKRLKPDPEGLLQALAQLGSAPGETLYVGDSVVDAEAGRNAGLTFAAVLTGVTPAEAFDAYPTCAVLPSVVALPDLMAAGEGR
jgi:phosphoglycolate phosphatase